MPIFHSIGLMSGTSLDGIDAAYLVTDGMGHIEAGPHIICPYSAAQRELLRAALVEAPQMRSRHERPAVIAQAEDMLTQAHAEVVVQLCTQAGLNLSAIDLIGFHGQTILHKPVQGLTVQIGDAGALYQILQRPVVYDFRAADVAAGGQGAPLVPIYHQALVTQARQHHPALAQAPLIAVVNIGGVANITLVRADGSLMASDVGPGNALLDDFMLQRRGVASDVDGACAAQGRIAQDILAYWLAHPFFGADAPKSLDRNAFSTSQTRALSDADGAATLTAFTAHAIALFAHHLSEPPDVWIICGGGAHNRTMMTMIADTVKKPIFRASDLRWSGDALEAHAFAYLAVRSYLQLPLSFPTTTGVPAPMTGGVLYRGP